MVRRVIRILAIGTTAALLLSGCTNSPTEPQQTTPTIPSLAFKGPKTNSSDPNVQSIDSVVTIMNVYTQQLSLLKALPGVQKGNTETWTYPLHSLTYTLTATLQPDGSAQWILVINGTDTSGAMYNNFTVGRGRTSADGKNGTWDVYDSTSTTPVSELTWTTNNNVLTGTLKSFQGESVDAQMVLINNPDNSGQLTLYAGTTLTYKAAWLADGTGNWWTYNPNGSQSGTGFWS